MSSRLLTIFQIKEAKELREKFNYTKKQLAREYEISETTMWYMLYGRKRKTNKVYNYKQKKPKPVYAYVDINGLIAVVKELRQKGLSSGQIAEVFDVPIQQINLIWCKTL